MFQIKKKSANKIISKKFAFTLAEVIITLGIIGVVAAMTLPALITSYQKRNAESHLKHFYSLMRQGIEMTANDPEADCTIQQSQIGAGKHGGLINWWNACFGRVIKTSTQKKSSGYDMITLLDGSAFTGYIANTKIVYFMYCTSPDKCGSERYDGRQSFLFTLIFDDNKGMQFYTGGMDYSKTSRESLLANCRSGLADEEKNGATISRRHTCAALIQRDGWRIAPDYPWQYSPREK